MERRNFAQHNGTTYAEVLEIVPNSIRGTATPGDSPEASIPMDAPGYDNQLSGFYPPDSGGFRWTKKEFSATLTPPAPGGGTELLMQLYIPESAMGRLGSMTLRTRFGGHALAPETWSTGGQHIFRRELDNSWLGGGPVLIEFSLDKALPPAAGDPRQLGIVVKEIAIRPE
jgi:hypothetical protein